MSEFTLDFIEHHPITTQAHIAELEQQLADMERQYMEEKIEGDRLSEQLAELREATIPALTALSVRAEECAELGMEDEQFAYEKIRDKLLNHMTKRR